MVVIRDKKRGPGQDMWATRSRMSFFKAQEASWRSHVASSDGAKFYDHMAKMYQIKYHGVDLKHNLLNSTTSLPMDEEIQSWTAMKAEKVKELTWEECTVLQNSEAAAFDSLKTVSLGGPNSMDLD